MEGNMLIDGSLDDEGRADVEGCPEGMVGEDGRV